MSTEFTDVATVIPGDAAFYRRALEALRADIRAAEAEESRMSAELAASQSRTAEMRRATVSLARLIARIDGGDPEAVAPPAAAVRHADVAARVLAEAGRPLPVAEIGERMRAAGHRVPDEPRIRDSAVFAAMNRRREVFVRIGRGRWGLVAWGEDSGRAAGEVGA